MGIGSILVIADDLTGAAEIAGIALRYGLSSQIVHQLVHPATADVLVLNSNSRSLKIDEALAHLARLFPIENTQQWDWVYLKFDSALRGHIKQELSFFHKHFQAAYQFFCPVNLHLDRVVHGDQYWVAGKPIAQTAFAQDPEFPVHSSQLLDVVGRDHWTILPAAAAWTPTIKRAVPAVASWEELHEWASHIPQKALCAGAAAFFEALLRQRNTGASIASEPAFARQKPMLYVCGSNHEQSVTRISKLATENIIYWEQRGGEREVAEKLRTLLKRNQVAVFAVGLGVTEPAQVIRNSMALSVGMLRGDFMPKELILEGGATANAVLEALQINVLLPLKEYAPGLIRSHVPHRELAITMKPGSYPWTEELWAFGPTT
ncbi:four-carbon acid sugar kinase family protein [Sphingobacterium griseoflavum]|uniref:Four-carbon acid sugar kinase N-terminal domain-containing protein n=1 Tax=Sphingobacterium griseoflavum TaxID=1474952 RepID=A0ABQ3HYB4_9SPHI|nr:four-carbon acid sugar kinase family protein [Sphingobacterium griseoflavum]GHE46978.1 hypothetical protein GCM10017764_32690 [Sphingobacterium griseoflavum]